MVINNKHKIIFIHIPRTGGSYITRELAGIGFKKVNMYGDTHFSVSVAREYVGEDIDNYNIFTVVRNPFDYYVSLYEYTKNSNCHEWMLFGEKGMSFKDWLYNIVYCETSDEVVERFKNDTTSTATLYKYIHDSSMDLGWLTFRFIYSIFFDWKRRLQENYFNIYSCDTDVVFFENLNKNLKEYFKGLYGKDVKVFRRKDAVNKSKRQGYKEYYDKEMIGWIYSRDDLYMKLFGYEFS